MRQGGYNIDYLRVETPAALSSALSEKSWDIILAEVQNAHTLMAPTLWDYSSAQVSDCPFVIVSGAMSDETGAATMKAGAHDYL